MNLRRARRQWVWESTQTRRKYSVNQDNVKAKEITVDNIKIAILAKGDSARYLGQKVTLQEHETEEIKKQAESSVGSVPQISSRIDLERFQTLSQTSSFQYGHHANDWLTQVERGHYHKNMKKRSRPRNERCFALSDRQKENTIWKKMQRT